MSAYSRRFVRYQKQDPPGALGSTLKRQRMFSDDLIISAIDASPLNCGLSGADWLDREGNVPVVIDEDVALFDDEGDSVYQIHVLFKSRGKGAVASAKESFRRMFEDYGADVIFGMVPDFRDDVKLLARWAGMKYVGKRETPEGQCELFVLSKEMWSEFQ